MFELIRDPSGSKKQTFNKIEELLDAKSLQLKNTTPTATPPFHHETVATLSSSYVKDSKETKTNNKSLQSHEDISNAPASNTKADMNKKSNIFTKELKVAFTKVAFQQWKIAIQFIKIEETNLKIQQQKAIIKTNHKIQ